jgi:membrane carboxypeptidase/penicillin-binding protein
VRHPAQASIRRQHVLNRLVSIGTLTRVQGDAAIRDGLRLANS